MPTVAEPVDEDRRRGRTQSVLEYFHQGMLGEDAARASLRILRYEDEDIRRLMQEHRPPKHREVRRR